MRPLGYGLANGGKGSLRADLGGEAMVGILLKKRGGRVARGGGSRSDSWPLGRCHVGQEGGGLSNVNACHIGTVNEEVGGCGGCDCRSRGGKCRGRARGGGGVVG